MIKDDVAKMLIEQPIVAAFCSTAADHWFFFLI
jgi:hypothetical protein